jgi:tocopherol O-methyltransferase
VITSRRSIGSADVAGHYNELDLFYREIWGEHLHHGLWIDGGEDSDQAVVQLVQLVAEKAQITRGTHVCDIGCGYGAAARLLARQMGAFVTAITVSESQHSYACEADPSGNPNYLLCDWLKMKLLPATFDAALAIESSEHMPDKMAFFSRALDILKSGGRLVVCSWLAPETSGASRQKWLLEPICREGRMPHLLNAGELVATARRAGFRAIEYDDISNKVARTWSIIISRFVRRLLSDPRCRDFLCHSGGQNRIFAATVFRIWLAYRTRSMRYGIFTFAK